MLTISGGGIYVFYFSVLPPEVKSIGREIGAKTTTAVEALPDAPKDLRDRSKPD